MKQNAFRLLCKKGLLAALALGLSFTAVIPASAADSYKTFEQKDYVDAEIVTVNPDGSLTYAK